MLALTAGGVFFASERAPSEALNLGAIVSGEIAVVGNLRGSAFVELAPGMSGPVTVEARSSQFDAYLIIWRLGAAGKLEKLAEDDDSAGWPHSRAGFDAEASSRYRAEIRSADIPYCGREFALAASAGRPGLPEAGVHARTTEEFQASLDSAAEAGGTPECRARALWVRGWVQIQNGNPVQAQSIAEGVLDIVTKELSDDHLLAAWGLDLKATALQHTGDYPAARPLFERGLEIRERVLGPNDIDVAVSLNNLGLILWLMGLHAEARPLMERAIALQESILGPENPGYLTSMGNLAEFLLSYGQWREARVIGERVVALRLQLQGPTHTDYAMSLGTLGQILGAAGAYEEALPALHEARLTNERALGARHPVTLRSLHNVSWMLQLMGRYSEARRFSEETVRLREEILGPDHPELAYSLNTLATTLQAMGADHEAKPLFERALAILEHRLGVDHDFVARAVNNLAVLLHAMGRPAEAAALYERSLGIIERKFGPGHQPAVITLGNLASAREDLGQMKEARSLYERALGAAAQYGLDEHPSTALNLLKCGNLLQKLGEPEEARKLLDRSLSIRRAALGEDHPETGQAYVWLSRLLYSIGDPGALEAALSAEWIGREHLLLTARTLPETRALQFASVRVSGLDLALSVAAKAAASEGKTGSRVWDAVIRSRASVLDEMASRRRSIGDGADAEVVAAAQVLRLASSRLANLMIRGPGSEPPGRYRGSLDQARSEKDAAEEALASRSAPFRIARSREQVGLPETLSSLPEESAMAAFSVYTRRRQEAPERFYLAFVARAGDPAPTVHDLGDAKSIEILVTRWREATGSPEANPADYRKAGEALRQRVWDPIASQLGDARTVFVVPDGALSLVSFAALPDDNGKFLIESGPTLHYLSAERDLIAPRAPPGPGGLLALGGADFDGAVSNTAPVVVAAFRGEHSACRSFSEMPFERLPGTEAEVRDILSLWPAEGTPPTALTGSAATEAAFKARAPGHRVLHLATHGFFLDGRCPSVLDSTRGVGTLVPAAQSPVAPPVTGENPLRLSGLALTGANRRNAAAPTEEDGILTAEEVASMDLSGVEWAVLSACDTGVGEVRSGEGVFGLRRAFQVAGAQTVIMSLWPVEDDAARAWMRSLYQARFRDHLGTADAVRRASLELLAARRKAGLSTNPFFWAGFVAAGDWR